MLNIKPQFSVNIFMFFGNFRIKFNNLESTHRCFLVSVIFYCKLQGIVHNNNKQNYTQKQLAGLVLSLIVKTLLMVLNNNNLNQSHRKEVEVLSWPLTDLSIVKV